MYINWEIRSGQHFLSKARWLFNAFISINLAAFVVVFLEARDDPTARFNFIDAWEYILEILVYVFFLTNGYLVFNRDLRKIRPDNSLHRRLKRYLNALLVKYLFFEVAVIVALSGLSISSNLAFSILFLGGFLAYSISNPTAKRVAKELQLDSTEMAILQNDDALKDR